VLPAGFVRIRHYGILSNRNRHEDVALCRELLCSEKTTEADTPDAVKGPEGPESITPTRVCPCCGAGRMIVIAEFGPVASGVEIMMGFEECMAVDSS
jgi:hypothetical protein